MNIVRIYFNLDRDGYTGPGDFSFAITDIGRIIHSVLHDSGSFRIKRLECSFDEHLIGEIECNVKDIDDVNKVENTLSWLCRLINDKYIGVDFNDDISIGREILEFAMLRELTIAIVATGEKSSVKPNFEIKPHIYLSYRINNANLAVTNGVYERLSDQVREKAILDGERWTICYPVVDNDILGLDWRLARVQEAIDGYTKMRDKLIKLSERKNGTASN